MYEEKELFCDPACCGDVVADVVAFYVRGTSSGLLFLLLAMLIYILLTGAESSDRCGIFGY